jgi:hypothetical protein
MTYCEMIYVISLQISYFEDNLFRKDAFECLLHDRLELWKIWQQVSADKNLYSVFFKHSQLSSQCMWIVLC